MQVNPSEHAELWILAYKYQKHLGHTSDLNPSHTIHEIDPSIKKIDSTQFYINSSYGSH